MQPSNHFLSAVALGISLLSSYAYGAPVVSTTSGTFSDNGSVTITGSGFGTKAAANPLVYDNFDAGTSGAKVLTNKATVGQWQNGAGYDVGVYTTEQTHAGGKSVKLSTAGGVYNMSLNQNGSFSTVYMDWWVRVNYSSGKSRNWKPWRLYGANDTMQANAVIMCNGSGMSTEPGSGNSFWWDAMSYGQGTWQHYQVILKASSAAGRADGVVKQYIDGVLTSNHTGVVTRTTSANWDQIRVGHYWAMDGVSECAANSGANIYIDSLYIDTSWARVELGNSATYAASTKREIQIPTSWADGKISVNLNAGSFASGTTAYVYVTDASGNVNSVGYPVKIGSSGSSSGTDTTTAPTAPTGLTVQ